ncbi:MAG: hypothetical protein ACT4O1_06125 [Gemmatimonadota bacterium]
MALRIVPFFLTCALGMDAAAQTPHAILQEAEHKNWIVRVIASGDSIGPGRSRTFKADSAVIGQSRIAIAAITQIDRQVRTGGGGGGAALAGAGMVGLLGLLIVSEFCEPNCSFRELAGGTAMGATLGATLGGFIGGAAKPSRREWTRIWPPEREIPR